MHQFFKILNGHVINYFLKQALGAIWKVRHSQNDISEPSPPHDTLCRFFLKPSSPLCDLRKDKLHQEIEQEFFLNMAAEAYQHYNKEVEKVWYCSFNLFERSLLHINAHKLTNYVDKMVELNTLDLVV